MSQAADSEIDSDIWAQEPGTQDDWARRQPEPWSEHSQQLAEISPLPPFAQAVQTPYLKLPLHHAEPLMPLRERDLKAIDDLFAQDGIEEIEADIVQNLPHHSPELHWDDWGSLVLKDMIE